MGFRKFERFIELVELLLELIRLSIRSVDEQLANYDKWKNSHSWDRFLINLRLYSILNIRFHDRNVS